MGKLNVSSVKAPSDAHSMAASPRISEQKLLESRVFGSGKRNFLSKQIRREQEQNTANLDMFLNEAE